MSHAGLVLLRELADRTGLTAGLTAGLPSPRAGMTAAGPPILIQNDADSVSARIATMARVAARRIAVRAYSGLSGRGGSQCGMKVLAEGAVRPWRLPGMS